MDGNLPSYLDPGAAAVPEDGLPVYLRVPGLDFPQPRWFAPSASEEPAPAPPTVPSPPPEVPPAPPPPQGGSPPEADLRAAADAANAQVLSAARQYAYAREHPDSRLESPVDEARHAALRAAVDPLDRAQVLKEINAPTYSVETAEHVAPLTDRWWERFRQNQEAYRADAQRADSTLLDKTMNFVFTPFSWAPSALSATYGYKQAPSYTSTAMKYADASNAPSWATYGLFGLGMAADIWAHPWNGISFKGSPLVESLARDVKNPLQVWGVTDPLAATEKALHSQAFRTVNANNLIEHALPMAIRKNIDRHLPPEVSSASMPDYLAWREELYGKLSGPERDEVVPGSGAAMHGNLAARDLTYHQMVDAASALPMDELVRYRALSDRLQSPVNPDYAIDGAPLPKADAIWDLARHEAVLRHDVRNGMPGLRFFGRPVRLWPNMAGDRFLGVVPQEWNPLPHPFEGVQWLGSKVFSDWTETGRLATPYTQVPAGFDPGQVDGVTNFVMEHVPGLTQDGLAQYSKWNILQDVSHSQAGLIPYSRIRDVRREVSPLPTQGIETNIHGVKDWIFSRVHDYQNPMPPDMTATQQALDNSLAVYRYIDALAQENPRLILPFDRGSLTGTVRQLEGVVAQGAAPFIEEMVPKFYKVEETNPVLGPDGKPLPPPPLAGAPPGTFTLTPKTRKVNGQEFVYRPPLRQDQVMARIDRTAADIDRILADSQAQATGIAASAPDPHANPMAHADAMAEIISRTRGDVTVNGPTLPDLPRLTSQLIEDIMTSCNPASVYKTSANRRWRSDLTARVAAAQDLSQVIKDGFVEMFAPLEGLDASKALSNLIRGEQKGLRALANAPELAQGLMPGETLAKNLYAERTDPVTGMTTAHPLYDLDPMKEAFARTKFEEMVSRQEAVWASEQAKPEGERNPDAGLSPAQAGEVRNYLQAQDGQTLGKLVYALNRMKSERVRASVYAMVLDSMMQPYKNAMEQMNRAVTTTRARAVNQAYADLAAFQAVYSPRRWTEAVPMIKKALDQFDSLKSLIFSDVKVDPRTESYVRAQVGKDRQLDIDAEGIGATVNGELVQTARSIDPRFSATDGGLHERLNEGLALVQNNRQSLNWDPLQKFGLRGVPDGFAQRVREIARTNVERGMGMLSECFGGNRSMADRLVRAADDFTFYRDFVYEPESRAGLVGLPRREYAHFMLEGKNSDLWEFYDMLDAGIDRFRFDSRKAWIGSDPSAALASRSFGPGMRRHFLDSAEVEAILERANGARAAAGRGPFDIRPMHHYAAQIADRYRTSQRGLNAWEFIDKMATAVPDYIHIFPFQRKRITLGNGASQTISTTGPESAHWMPLKDIFPSLADRELHVHSGLYQYLKNFAPRHPAGKWLELARVLGAFNQYMTRLNVSSSLVHTKNQALLGFLFMDMQDVKRATEYATWMYEHRARGDISRIQGMRRTLDRGDFPTSPASAGEVSPVGRFREVLHGRPLYETGVGSTKTGDVLRLLGDLTGFVDERLLRNTRHPGRYRFAPEGLHADAAYKQSVRAGMAHFRGQEEMRTVAQNTREYINPQRRSAVAKLLGIEPDGVGSQPQLTSPSTWLRGWRMHGPEGPGTALVFDVIDRAMKQALVDKYTGLGIPLEHAVDMAQTQLIDYSLSHYTPEFRAWGHAAIPFFGWRMGNTMLHVPAYFMNPSKYAMLSAVNNIFNDEYSQFGGVGTDRYPEMMMDATATKSESYDGHQRYVHWEPPWGSAFRFSRRWLRNGLSGLAVEPLSYFVTKVRPADLLHLGLDNPMRKRLYKESWDDWAYGKNDRAGAMEELLWGFMGAWEGAQYLSYISQDWDRHKHQWWVPLANMFVRVAPTDAKGRLVEDDNWKFAWKNMVDDAWRKAREEYTR